MSRTEPMRPELSICEHRGKCSERETRVPPGFRGSVALPREVTCGPGLQGGMWRDGAGGSTPVRLRLVTRSDDERQGTRELGAYCEDVGVGAEPLSLTCLRTETSSWLLLPPQNRRKAAGWGLLGVLRRHPGPCAMYLTPVRLVLAPRSPPQCRPQLNRSASGRCEHPVCPGIPRHRSNARADGRKARGRGWSCRDQVQGLFLRLVPRRLPGPRYGSLFPTH